MALILGVIGNEHSKIIVNNAGLDDNNGCRKISVTHGDGDGGG
jgi:hypothetical protein